MKKLVSVMFLTITAIAFGQSEPSFAKTDRLFTVSLWCDFVETTWGVQEERIVVYKWFANGRPEELLADIPVPKEKIESIRQAFSAIPSSARGYVHTLANDGLILRIAFASDWHIQGDEIELMNVWYPWVDRPLEAISEALPAALAITYSQEMKQSKFVKVSPDRIRKTTVKEYHQIESNQPPEAMPVDSPPIKRRP